MPRRPIAAPLLLCAALLGGCASTAPAGPGGTSAALMAPSPADPWEAWNRKVFAFNDALDEAVLKPVATAYRDALPRLVRTGVDNLLGNVGDLWSTANLLLQGKVEKGLNMGMRFLTNTLFGLGGLLDPATEARLLRHSEDFGQTLGHWGVGPGPYVVLPLFGPRTLRDTFGLLVDRQYDADRLLDSDAGRYGVLALGLVHARANLLSASRLLEQVALDRYSFVRDAYLARRQDAVYDGAPPAEVFDDFQEDPAKQPGK